MKRCTQCQIEKPLDSFALDKSGAQGRKSRCKECIKEYYTQNAYRWKNYVKKYHENNPEKIKMHHDAATHNRRTQKQNSFEKVTQEELRELYAESEDHCGYCGIRLFGKYHIDHIQPLSRKGAHSKENLCICCSACNLSKNNKTVDEWLQVRGW